MVEGVQYKQLIVITIKWLVNLFKEWCQIKGSASSAAWSLDINQQQHSWTNLGGDDRLIDISTDNHCYLFSCFVKFSTNFLYQVLI